MAEAPTTPKTRQGQGSVSKTAFVLAGGGSLGAVEVGMLLTLLEAGIVPDLIVGASVGALNGAFLAARPDLDRAQQLARVWRQLHRRDVFPVSFVGGLLSLLSLRNHLVDPTPLRRLLQRHLRYRELGEAAVPLHIVTTDILLGTEVVLSSGSVLEAVMASAAIPGVFPPVELDGLYLADGGIANNTPISAAVARGADRIIVLPTGVSCDIDQPPSNSLAMALHGLSLLIARQLVADIELFAERVALRVVPPLCPLETTPVDFSRAGELIDRAAESTRTWMEDGGLEKTVIPDHMRPHEHRS